MRPAGPCNCELCYRLINASHLKVKKPKKADKKIAVEKMATSIQQLAAEKGIHISNELAEEMACHPDLTRSAAYVAYANSLLDRINGYGGGIYALVLWRIFAWKPEGSPLRNFELEVDAILEAKVRLLEEIKRKHLNE